MLNSSFLTQVCDSQLVDDYDVPYDENTSYEEDDDYAVPNSSSFTQAGDSQSTGTSCCRQRNDHQPSMHRRPNTR